MSAVTLPVRVQPRVERRSAFVEQIMGMPISVHIRTTEPARDDLAAAAHNVFSTLRKIDRLFSLWSPDSELSRLIAGSLPAGEGHPWQAEIVDLCLEAEEVTEGLFSAWRPAPGGGVRTYDPTGVVKGWAVERAAETLRMVDGISFCIAAGGDLVAGTGRALNWRPTAWRVGIADPYSVERVAGSVQVRSGAVATSGAAARGAHIIDPRTGAPLSRTGSATVVGPELSWCDIWATAAFVDPEHARALMAARAPGYHLAAIA